jgi:hypothetical protein
MTEFKTDTPPVFFNHLYLVIGDKTYRAIQASDFLRTAFPGMERRSTRTAAGENWVGTYYYGLDNYLEFFGASTGKHWQPAAKEGWAGLAFSTDRPGSIGAVKERVQAVLGAEPFSELRQLSLPDKTVNWFHQVRLAETLGLQTFESWVMEYHRDIFKHKGIALPASADPTRQAYLSPFNQPRTGGPDPVFRRVIGATIAMDDERARQFSQVLQALGYEEKEETGQIVLSAHGFTLAIRIHSEDAAPPGYRLSSIQLEMSRPSVAPMTFVFAPCSRLVLHENLTADWYFWG